MPLQPYDKISKEDCRKTQEAINGMQGVPYALACGSLMYVVVATKPEIVFVVGVVSRFMANPIKAHMRYLKGTKYKCLCYEKDPLELKGFCDSNMAKMWIHRNLEVAMYSHLQVVLYHGAIGCKRLLLCSLLRLNILKSLRLPRKRYG